MTFSEIYKNTRMPNVTAFVSPEARWWDAGVMKISKQVKRDGKGKNDRGV